MPHITEASLSFCSTINFKLSFVTGLIQPARKKVISIYRKSGLATNWWKSGVAINLLKSGLATS